MPTRPRNPLKNNYKLTIFLLKGKTMFFDIQRSKEVGEILGTEKVKRRNSSLEFKVSFWKKLLSSGNF